MTVHEINKSKQFIYATQERKKRNHNVSEQRKDKKISVS